MLTKNDSTYLVIVIKIIIYEFLISLTVSASYISDNITPINFKITLIPYVENFDNLTFDGEIHSEIEIKNDTNGPFVFYVKNLKIKKNIILINSIMGYNSEDYDIDDKSDLLTIRFAENITKGNYTLIVMYSGLISRNLSEAFIYIPYQDAFGEKQWLLSTKISNTRDASKIFPCWFDDGSTKTTFELSLRHNREHTALSNTRHRLTALSTTDYDYKWTIFEKTPLLFPQQLAFIIGNFECSTHYDEAYRVWTLTDADNNYENLSIIGGKIWRDMKNLTGITNRDKIIENFDFVILNNITLPQVNPFYSYGILITNNEIVTFIKNNSEIWKPKTKLHQQISFSICMQWYPFYNFQSNNDNDVILNYGIIAYLVAATTDQFYESPYAVEKIIHQVSYFRDIDLTIIKIIHIIGQVNLRNLLHNLAVQSHSGVLETNYLLKKYSEILGVNILIMMEILGNLLLTEGYPVVNVTRDYSRHSITIRQKRFSKNPLENLNEKYWIPLNYATENNPNFDDTTVTRWINPDSNKIVMSVAAANDQWIICNKQLIGNYRVNYDEKNWKLIIDYLKTSKYVKIHPVNRAQIIDDLLTLMEFGHINSNLLFELDDYLKQETDSIPMTRFWNYFFYIYDNFFYRKDDYYVNFMNHFLINRNKNLNIFFCNVIRVADQNRWDKLYKLYNDYKRIGIYQALGCSSNKNILNNFMSMVLNSNSVKSNFILKLMFESIAKKSIIGVDSILDFLIVRQNKAKLKTQADVEFIIIGTIIAKNFVKNGSQLEKLKDVLKNGRPYFGKKRIENYYKIAESNVRSSI